MTKCCTWRLNSADLCSTKHSIMLYNIHSPLNLKSHGGHSQKTLIYRCFLAMTTVWYIVAVTFCDPRLRAVIMIQLLVAMKYSDWTLGHTEALINKLGGVKRAKLFLSGQLIVVSPDQVFKPSTLNIDRTNPFDPAKFIGEGWSIWRGPKDKSDPKYSKGLEGDEEQDRRSLAITEIDPAKLLIQTGLKDKETTIVGEEKRARLLLESIQADAKIGEALYKEEGQATLKWLHKTLNVTWLEFLGTTGIIYKNDGLF
jgi:hypothetical protein